MKHKSRSEKYTEYREKDMNSEVSQELYSLVDDCLGQSEKALNIHSNNKYVKMALNELFYDKLNLEVNLKLWIRDLAKYGDYFILLQLDKKEGVLNCMSLPVEEVYREEGYDKTEQIRFKWNNEVFEEWQVAHFRLIDNNENLPYGVSVLETGRYKRKPQLQVDMIRNAIISELNRIANIHLYFSGFKNGIDEFKLSF